MNILKDSKLSTKIVLGFSIVAFVLIAAVGITIFQVQKSSAVTNRVVDLRVPTANASLMMLNGINHSLAALRGWMLLGNEKFKSERTTAWDEEITPSLDSMVEFSKTWTNPKNKDRLASIQTTLDDLKTFQAEIEVIAQTTENTPANKILFEEAAPKASLMVANITKLIDLEAEQGATEERKALLGMMADVRGTTGLSLAAIRAYLLSGDKAFTTQFETLWAKNIRRFGDLTNQTNLLTPEQLKAFTDFSKARTEFLPLHALTRIRSFDSKVPVIVCTGNLDLNLATMAGLGVQEIVRKPFTKHALCSAVGRAQIRAGIRSECPDFSDVLIG